MRIYALLFGVILTASPAIAQQSDEYKKGYCEGWKAAADAVWSNRNHNRALSGYAAETQDQAMKRIRTSWPAPPPPVLEGSQSHLAGTSIQKTVEIMLDAVDLYVVLPPAGCVTP